MELVNIIGKDFFSNLQKRDAFHHMKLSLFHHLFFWVWNHNSFNMIQHNIKGLPYVNKKVFLKSQATLGEFWLLILSNALSLPCDLFVHVLRFVVASSAAFDGGLEGQ